MATTDSRPVRITAALWLILLPVAESVYVSFRYDAATLRDRLPQWWAYPISHAGSIIPILFACFLAWWVFGRQLSSTTERALPAPRLRLAWLAAHLLAFVAFAVATHQVFAADDSATPVPGIWALAWIALGGICVLLLVLAVYSRRALVEMIAVAARPLAAIAAIGLAAWGAGQLTAQAWNTLSYLTLGTVHAMLSLFFAEAYYDPTIFLTGTPEFPITIAPVCSGYQGIGLIWVVFAAYLWFFRRELRFPRALLLLPIGTLIIWVANAVRITALVAVGTCISPSIAAEGFHSRAGWLFFCVVSAVLIWLSMRLRYFASARAEAEMASLPDASKGPDPTAAFLAPFLITVAASLVVGAFADDLDYLYPLMPVAGLTALWWFRRTLGRGWIGWSWTSAAIGVITFAIFWVDLVARGDPDPDRASLQQRLGAVPAWYAAMWLFFRICGAVVIVPIVEELAFRGYLIRRLISVDFQAVDPRRFTALSFFGSSVAFGMLHSAWIPGTLAGMLFALVVYHRGRLGDAVFAHFVANALVVLHAALSGNWSLIG